MPHQRNRVEFVNNISLNIKEDDYLPNRELYSLETSFIQYLKKIIERPYCLNGYRSNRNVRKRNPLHNTLFQYLRKETNTNTCTEIDNLVNTLFHFTLGHKAETVFVGNSNGSPIENPLDSRMTN